jgi:hypothetical protein
VPTFSISGNSWIERYVDYPYSIVPGANVDHCRIRSGGNDWYYGMGITVTANWNTGPFTVAADCWSSDGTMSSRTMYVQIYD